MRAPFTATILLGALLVSAPQAINTTTTTTDPGKLVFNNVCATCHTEQPPAKLAPPMSHVIRHYRTELGSDDAIRTAITEWIVNPSAEMSLLPEHAIERFGLMAGITTLTEKETHDVITYILTLTPDSTMRMQMNMPDSMKAGNGMGRMNHGNMKPGGMNH